MASTIKNQESLFFITDNTTIQCLSKSWRLFIKPTPYKKSFRILIDNKLNWKQHICYINKT